MRSYFKIKMLYLSFLPSTFPQVQRPSTPARGAVKFEIPAGQCRSNAHRQRWGQNCDLKMNPPRSALSRTKEARTAEHRQRQPRGAGAPRTSGSRCAEPPFRSLAEPRSRAACEWERTARTKPRRPGHPHGFP